MASFDEAWLHRPWFDPLDFSCIPRYSNVVDKNAFQIVPKFKSHEEWATNHVLAFIEYLKAWDIVAEDAKMR